MQKQISSSDAFEFGRKLPYIYFVSVSQVFIGKTDEAGDLDEILNSSGLQEVRFFDEYEEYRVYRYNEAMLGSYISDEGAEEKYLIKKGFLIENNRKFGKKIYVRCYIEADDEGQNYIAYSRLCGWDA